MKQVSNKTVLSRWLLAGALVTAANSSFARMVEGAGPTEVGRGSPVEKSWVDGMKDRWEIMASSVKSWWDNGENKTPVVVKPTVPVEAPSHIQTQPVQAVQPQQTEQATAKTGMIPTELPKKKLVDSTPGLQAYREAPALKTAKVGRAADPSLRKSASGVPIFDLEKTIPVKKGPKDKAKPDRMSKVKVDKIPVLDIGEEPSLRQEEFEVPEVKIGVLSIPKFQEQKSPLMMTDKEEKTWLTTGLELVGPTKKVILSFLGDQQVATIEKVRAIMWKLGAEQPVTLLPYTPFNAEDLKALAALIMVEKKDQCHLVSGLLSDLSNSKNAEYSSMANFNLGLCLHEMGFFSESVHRLLRVISGNHKEYIPRAIAMVVRDLPQEFVGEVSDVLRKVPDTSIVPKEGLNGFHYVIGTGSLKKSDYKTALNHALKVVDGPLLPKAQYVAAVSEYGLGRAGESLDRQKKLLKSLEEKNGDSTLMALIALNLGRTAYMEKKYDESAQYFLKIRKDNPLWIQALTEQGWAQLQSKDYPGAIGNMYSIHSPFFKNVYKPESFVVRTIGYLGICQFGDAYRTLSQLESQYRNWLDKVTEYQKHHKASADFYASTVKYLKSPSDSTVDGLPAQVLREMARHRDYLNIQEGINNRVDEMEQYTHINAMIEREKGKVKWKSGKAGERIADLEGKLRTAHKNPDSAKFINEWKSQLNFEKDLIDYYKFLTGVYEEGRAGLMIFKAVASKRLNETKERLKAQAGVVLQKRLALMSRELGDILENNEFLRYEVFAGSGENIRVQVAANEGEKSKGGGEARRIPASVKPQNKELQWAFDGEYWEDEIGNYRSSLKDNCGRRSAAATP